MKIEKLVKTFEGKVDKSETWGEIELAYRIKKEKSGYFLHFNLSLNPKFAKTLNEKLRVDGEIIRYLLIRIDKSKGEAVVTLLAAVVPIPVTVKLDNVKVIRRGKEDEETQESEGEEKESQEGEPKINKDYEPSGGLIPDDY